MTRPELMRERAAALAYGRSDWQVPVARDAATVCLLREPAIGSEGDAGSTSGDFEVFLMRRPMSMRFAPGMNVFPGGSVEGPDPEVPVVPGSDFSRLGRRAATPAPRALLAAAVRETFEECGVLLAVDRDGNTPPAWPSLHSDRHAIDDGRLGLGELLELRGLALDPMLLALVGHWITPEVLDRRFDTRFFVARMPAGQTAGEVGTESDGSGWWSPAAAVERHRAGELDMMAPTVASLQWLAAYPSVEAVFAAAADAAIRPLLPRPVPDGTGGVRWVMYDGRTGDELAPEDTAMTEVAQRLTAASAAGVDFDGPLLT